MKRIELPDHVELGLSQDPYSKEVRETFANAKPLLKELEHKYPGIDCLYILCLLREQTLIAVKWPDRRVIRAWRGLLEAWDFFQGAIFTRREDPVPTLARIRRIVSDAQRIAKAEGIQDMQWRPPEEIWKLLQSDKAFSKVDEGLEDIRGSYVLPPHTESGEGGRPTFFQSDAVALAMKEYFQKHTNSPQWRTIGRLLECASAIRGISMQPDKIRQRVVRWQREERAPELHTLTLGDMAHELKGRCMRQAAPRQKGKRKDVLKDIEETLRRRKMTKPK